MYQSKIARALPIHRKIQISVSGALDSKSNVCREPVDQGQGALVLTLRDGCQYLPDPPSSLHHALSSQALAHPQKRLC